MNSAIPPDEYTRDSRTLALDPLIPPGEYVLRTGLYPKGEPQQRVPILDANGPSKGASFGASLRVGGGGAGKLRRWCEDVAGVTLGSPLGMAEPGDPVYDDWLRIGHMGHVNAHMVLGVLATMEAGMTALGVPHGAGALDAATAATRNPHRPNRSATRHVPLRRPAPPRRLPLINISEPTRPY